MKVSYFLSCMMRVCIGMSTTSFPTAFASKAYTKNKVLFLWVMLLAPCCFAAPLTLPTIFSENMVLQRDQAVPVWGNAGSGLQVTVEFAGQVKTTTADNDGLWRVDLTALSASSTAQTFTVSSGTETIEYTNILVGEVWLCSGQSNMAWDLRGDTSGADHPLIRMYKNPLVFSASPQETVNAVWEVCTPTVADGFSAVAYYFGVTLQEELGVPIGLLQSAWGGTRIEPWTPRIGFESVLESVPEFQSILDEIDALTELNVDKQSPTALYNAMIYPHLPFAMRGVIWYQGEANVTEGMLYRDKTEAQLYGWRQLWGYDFPYYFVQLAPFDYGHASNVLPEFWEAQSAIVETISNTGMAVISDAVSNINSIHPTDKQTPGTRLALLALDNTYGHDIVSTGPVFDYMVPNGNTIEVYFDSAVGLTTRDGEAPDWFEIAENYSGYTPAVAVIVNDHVVLSSPTVTSPIAMRFAWNEVAMPNLVNAASLVASAFRAGEEVEPSLFTDDPINEIFAEADAAYSSSIADDVSNPEGYPLTFSKESGPAWLDVDEDGILSGTPSDSDLGDNVFTVQVEVVGGSDTATLNITVVEAGTRLIVKWGEAGGETETLTAGTNTAGQNPFPAVYNPATLVNPADGTNGYNVNAFGRTNELSGAFSDTNTTPVFVNNAAGDYMQLVYNGDFTQGTPFETMVAWDSSKFLSQGSSNQLKELTVEFKERSPSNVPTVSFVVETSAGWYVTDQTDTTGSTYKSFTLDAASATFSGFNKFEVTAGSGQPDLSDLQSVGVLSSTTNTAVGWTGTFIRHINVVAIVVSNQAPSFTDDPINEIAAEEDAAYSSSIADDVSDPDRDPMTFSKVSGPPWLTVASNGTLSGTPSNSDIGDNVFTVQVDVEGGSDTATLNITVLAADSNLDIVKWGEAGGDTQILTVDGNLRGQNAFPADYNPATLVNPANGTNGYNVNAVGRTNEFSGAYSSTTGTPVFVGNTAGDYMQLVCNSDFTVTPFETMVAWDSSKFLAQGSSQLEELTVEFKGRSGNDVPTVSFVVETSAGWYVTDQTDTTGTSYKSFILDAASATFSGFNKFGVTAGSGQPDLSDIQSVGVFSSTTTGSTGFAGTFVRYINVVTSVVSNQGISGDLTGDGIVNMEDIAELGKLWLNPHDINTLHQIANNWLYGTLP